MAAALTEHTMARVFEWKHLPIQRPSRLELDAVGAVLANHKGTIKARVEFATVRELRFASMGGGSGSTMRWFDIMHDAGRFRLQCNTSREDDPAVASYKAAVGGILRGIEARKPGLEVDLGVGRATKTAMFLLGVAFVAMGVACPVGVIYLPKRFPVGGGLFLAFATGLAGTMLMRRYSRPSNGPRASVADLARDLSAPVPG